MKNMKSETKTSVDLKTSKEAPKQVENISSPTNKENKEINSGVSNFVNTLVSQEKNVNSGTTKKITEKKAYKILKEGGLIDAYQCRKLNIIF
jgi:hypothetical protein